jgi:transcriptional regulator with XRE-family HTH domain
MWAVEKANGKLRVREIARRSGISVSGVSRLLRGRRIPRMDTAVKLAKGMGISLDELMRRLPSGPV